jgi:soluble lytic murein transglycosylase-like protein
LKALMPAETMQPVAYALDDGDQTATTEQRVASVEKAGRLAAQLADLHAREQRQQAEQSRTAALIRGGGLDGWIAEALQIMGLPQDLAPGVKQIIMSESGGNPRAVNTWDSNALHGTPSRGLMQTIPSTFRTYVHPDLAGRSITDPVANITAGVRYMIDRYGVDTVRAGGRTSAGGSYLGY